MPLASPVAWSHAAVRLVIALCAFTLLATAVAVAAEPASATGLSDQISANRSGQLYSEQAMRTQDQILQQVKRDQKQTKKDLRRAQRDLKRGKRALATAQAVVRERRARLARVAGEFEDPLEAPSPERYEERLKEIRRSIRQAERRKSAIGKRVRAMTRTVGAKRATLRSLKRQRGAAISRREAAEGALASRIIGMTSLAAARADNQTAVSLAGSRSFSWPTTGRISQVYGCTGFRLNPRRGSCRHFHDGVDIVDVTGTPVRAVAVGVVAYAGWNPWDERGRAWIVVVVHPDGYVSRYGHLTPTDRVRAGELVHTGQIIGKMGNTGRSTGTHLHFELLRGGKDVNPQAYLPAGVIKVVKTSTKKGVQALKAKKKARKKARARKRAKAKAREEAQALAMAQACAPNDAPEFLAALYGFVVTAQPAEGVECESDGAPTEVVEDAGSSEPTSPAAESPTPESGSGPAVAELPGVPTQMRGTSAVPA